MKIVIVLFMAFSLLLLACAHTPQSRPVSSDFARFVDEYFEARYAFRPTEGASVGLHQYDTKLEDLSRARFEARIAELKEQLARLEALDRSHFSFDDSIDAAALDGEIRGELLELETLRNWERNPMRYAGLPGGAVDDLIKRNFAPPSERLRSVIARLNAIPSILAAAKANLQNPPKEFTDLAIRMAKGSAGFFEGSVAAWAKEAAGGDAAFAREFSEENAKVVAASRSPSQPGTGARPRRNFGPQRRRNPSRAGLLPSPEGSGSASSTMSSYAGVFRESIFRAVGLRGLGLERSRRARRSKKSGPPSTKRSTCASLTPGSSS